MHIQNIIQYLEHRRYSIKVFFNYIIITLIITIIPVSIYQAFFLQKSEADPGGRLFQRLCECQRKVQRKFRNDAQSLASGKTSCGSCSPAEQVETALPTITLMASFLHQSWTPRHHTDQPSVSEQTLLPQSCSLGDESMGNLEKSDP